MLKNWSKNDVKEAVHLLKTDKLFIDDEAMYQYAMILTESDYIEALIL